MLNSKGGWKALDTAGLRDLVHAATMVGRLAAAERAVELGYAITPDAGPSGKLDHWAIAGIPRDVVELFSKRSDEIDAAIEHAGFTSYQARGVAARETRGAKQPESPEALVDRCVDELDGIRWSVRDDAVDGWVADQRHTGDRPALLLAWRRANVTALNQRARARWAQAGRLHGSEIEVAGRRYAAGDRILALAPHHTAGVVTSQCGTVIDVDTHAITARMDNGRTVRLEGDAFGPDRLDHGYAATVHRTQGATAPTGRLLADGGGRELTYVALSRTPDPPTSTSSPTTLVVRCDRPASRLIDSAAEDPAIARAPGTSTHGTPRMISRRPRAVLPLRSGRGTSSMRRGR